MNGRQKIVILIAAVIILSALIVWLAGGGELLTKSQVLVDKTTELDKMLGVKNEVWEQKFILGLDYTLGFSGFIAVVSGILFFVFRNKKNKETK